jgi:mono/diheme cytochrome c family protein
VSGEEITIGLVALVLVVFSLVVSILIPRRDPGFPGRNLRVFLLVAALLVVGMLTAVEVLGETEHREGAEATQAETGGGEPSGPAETGGGQPSGPAETGGAAGDPAAGKQIFTATAQPPCSSCHTLADAGASGTVGPNLDEVLMGKDAAFIRESILEPNAEIADGFSGGIMPQDYGEKLDEKQVADLVAYLLQATQ